MAGNKNIGDTLNGWAASLGGMYNGVLGNLKLKPSGNTNPTGTGPVPNPASGSAAGPAPAPVPAPVEASLVEIGMKIPGQLLPQIQNLGKGLGYGIGNNLNIPAAVIVGGGLGFAATELFKRSRKETDKEHDGMRRFGAFMAGTATALCGGYMAINATRGIIDRTHTSATAVYNGALKAADQHKNGGVAVSGRNP